MQLLLSTIILPADLDASAQIERWRRLSGGAFDGIAIDAAKPATLQRALIEASKRAGLRCGELMHPFRLKQSRPMPQLCSADRAEREAARQALDASIVLAAEAAIPRLLLFCQSLALATNIDSLCQRVFEDRPLPLEDLLEQRAHLIDEAMDYLRRELDCALEQAARLEISIALMQPAPWPHHFPNVFESDTLVGEFDGAPLETVYCTDWAHVQAQILEQPAESETASPSRFLRIADACGTTMRLPPATGEVDWSALRSLLAKADEGVLTLDPHVSADEVSQALEFLSRAS